MVAWRKASGRRDAILRSYNSDKRLDISDGDKCNTSAQSAKTSSDSDNHNTSARSARPSSAGAHEITADTMTENHDRPVGCVLGRKHDADGSSVGSYHLDLRVDTRQYKVEFDDGAREAYVNNTIAQSLYSSGNRRINKVLWKRGKVLWNRGKVLWNGGKVLGMKAKSFGMKAKSSGMEAKSWNDGKVLWNGGTTSMETLTALCGPCLNALTASLHSRIAEGSAFKFLAEHAIKKCDRLIKKVFERKRMRQ